MTSKGMAKLQPRQKAQLIIAAVFIAFALGGEAGYIYTHGFDDDLVKQIVRDYHILIAAGIGAALALYGLGRSVQPEPEPPNSTPHTQ